MIEMPTIAFIALAVFVIWFVGSNLRDARRIYRRQKPGMSNGTSWLLLVGFLAICYLILR